MQKLLLKELSMSKKKIIIIVIVSIFILFAIVVNILNAIELIDLDADKYAQEKFFSEWEEWWEELEQANSEQEAEIWKDIE